MSKGQVYAPDVRRKAIAKVEEVGLAKAVKETGIPKSTLHSWCADAGQETASAEATARTEAATAASVLSRRQRVAEAQAAMTDALATIADLSAKAEIKILEKAAKGKGKASLSEIVGSRTRAIHDMQLLNGDATERTEVNVEVNEIMTLQRELQARMSGA